MSLRENVVVKTPTGTLTGYLFVGQDGLPRLRVCGTSAANGYTRREIAWYSGQTFPAVWQLQQAEPDAGILFDAWRTIAELRWDIAQAQRETEEGHDAQAEREAEDVDG